MYCYKFSRYLRNKLSPVFTSGKLKWMFEQILTSGEKFVANFDKKVPLDQEVDLREEYARYTTDIISKNLPTFFHAIFNPVILEVPGVRVRGQKNQSMKIKNLEIIQSF